MTRAAQRRTAARGFYAVGIIGGKTPENLGTLWRTADLHEAAFVFTVGRRYSRVQASDTTNATRHIPLHHYRDVEDLVEHLPHGCPLVGVELDDRAWPLTGYRHPERAAYLLGAEDHGLTPAVRDRCHQLVQIPTPQPWSMNVAVAGALVIHDRYTKATALRAELRGAA